MESLFVFFLALVFTPFFPGFILKVKAWFGGKKGPSIFISYYTLLKLLRKTSVYSTSTSLLFRMGPVFSFAAGIMALLFFPFAGIAPVLSFHGDVILLFYVLSLGRFFTIAAAMDTASPFEGMGAAREAFFPALAEVALFALLILFYRMNGSLSLADYFSSTGNFFASQFNTYLLLISICALFMLLLAENCRVPADDPATHLELTMIHEVMILDHSGPDLALIEFGAFAKLFFYASFVANLILSLIPVKGLLAVPVFFALLFVVYGAVGCVESGTARLKMNMVPKFILTSLAMAFFAVILTVEIIP